jgi:hypothetical protein
MDGVADTCVLGRGNVVGFDHETDIKQNLQTVSAITALDLPNGKSVLLVIYESIYNEISNHLLLSECQLRDFGIIIDSISHRHGGTQK